MYNSSGVWARFENDGAMKKYVDSDLHDPRWKELRLKVIERDDGRCQMCHWKGGVRLQVHHKRYSSGKKAWEYDMELLISLCSKCHAKHHGKYKFQGKKVKKGRKGRAKIK